jgi:hypothetical protein
MPGRCTMVKRHKNSERDLLLRTLGFHPKPLLVEEFGCLSPVGARRLEATVIESFATYYWHRLKHELEPPSSKVEHYRRVGNAAERLVDLLGAGQEEFGPTPDSGLSAALIPILLEQAEFSDLAYSVLGSAWLSPGGAVEERTLRSEPILITHHAVLRLATLYLGPLARAAQAAQREAATRLKPGRGGRLHTESKATVRLLVELIRAYDQARRRHPKSGEPLGYSKNGPLERFVRAALSCADKDEYPELGTITPDAVRGAFRRYRREAATVVKSSQSER